MQGIEVRAFGELMKIFRERGWSWPLHVELKDSVNAMDLARQLDLPVEKIEVVFVNGFAQLMDYQVQPGDRIAFVPPGTPGPYRLMLGLVQKQEKAVELGKQQ